MGTSAGWGDFSTGDSNRLVVATSTPVLICDSKGTVVSANAVGAVMLDLLTPNAERRLPPTGWEMVTLTGETFDPLHGAASADDPDSGLIQIRSLHDSRGAWYSFQRIVLDPDDTGPRFAFTIHTSPAYEAAARMWRHERLGNDVFATVTVAPDGAIAVHRHEPDGTSEHYDTSSIRIIAGESVLHSLTEREAPLSEWLVVELIDMAGSRRVIEADGWGRRLPDGTLVVDVVARDITHEAEVKRQLDEVLERFTVATEHANHVVAELVDGRITWVSGSITAVLGYEPADFLGLDAEQAAVVLGRPGSFAALGDCSAEEVPVMCKDGSSRWVKFMIRLHEAGDDFRLLVSLQDVDDMHRGNDELAAARAYQEAVFEQGSDAVLVFDRDGTIRFGADRYRQLMGLGPDVLPGSGWIGRADAIARRIVEDANLEIRTAPHGTTTTCQFRTRKPDGEEIELDSVLTNRLADPILAGVVVSVRDVTARNESERRFSMMARLAGEGLMAMHSYTSMVAFANDAMSAMTGLSADELVGASWRSFVHPDDIDRMKTEWLATPTGEISRIAVRILRPDGSVVPVTITAASPYDQNPNDRWTFAVVTDVSELRRTQDDLDAAVRQAQRASAAKSRVVYDVSHEMRTPLAPIVAFSELLVETTDDPTVREYANHILRGSERLTRLADDLVDISRIESGVVPVELAPVHALAVCREAAAGLAGEAELAGRSVTVEGDDVTVRGDAVRLIQVVSNLAHNALAHALTDVTVDVRRNGDRALISVMDRGPGIPLEH
ncbi:MAG: hypothetical protein RLZZ362_1206, partial [Actinomycetota bacterium]